MVILGIETSCDETGIGLIKNNCVISNLIASQDNIHFAYGGVVPELASRAHLESIDTLFLKALEETCLTPEEIDVVGVTNHPGLKGCLLMGVSFACGLATALNIPLYMVNHIYAHVAANFLNSQVCFPAIGFVISGGHTTFFYMGNPIDFNIIGQTVDDACGETFDKVGRMLGLDFPGGPHVEQEALRGNENRIKFPVVLLSKDSFDFSFSGLKTSVLYYVRKHGIKSNLPDICAGFQKAVGDVLIEKTKRVLKQYQPVSLLIGGGVIQNKYLQDRFRQLAFEYNVRLFIPDRKLCMDNGAMVAVMTSLFMEKGILPSDKKITVIPT